MRGVVLTGHGDIEKLVWRDDLPMPVPGPGEVLIEVGACGLNNTDVNTRTAWYSKATHAPTTGDVQAGAGKDDGTWGGKSISFPRIQGADVVGRVVSVDSQVDMSLINRRVMIDPWIRDPENPLDMDKAAYLGSEIDGGFAEFTKVPATAVFPIVSDLTDAELATFATSYVTAENMLNRAAVAAGDVVLITGASGGVGSALTQLAKRRGATTVGMCAHDKVKKVLAIGADAAIPRVVEDLASTLEAAIGRRSVTVVADVVGGSMWPQLIAVLARGGRYTCAGAIAGPVVEFDLRIFYLRDLTFTGATVVPPGTFADLVGYIERGEIRPILAAKFALRDLRIAQQAFISKQHVGNIVVEP